MTVDTDALLNALRNAVGQWLDSEDDSDSMRSLAAGDEMASAFIRLDALLSKGGSLPGDWSGTRR